MITIPNISLFLSIIAIISVFLLRYLRIDVLEAKIKNPEIDFLHKLNLLKIDVDFCKRALLDKKTLPKMPDFQGAIDSVLKMMKKESGNETDGIIENANNVRTEEMEQQIKDLQTVNDNLLDVINEKGKEIESYKNVIECIRNICLVTESDYNEATVWLKYKINNIITENKNP